MNTTLVRRGIAHVTLDPSGSRRIRSSQRISSALFPFVRASFLDILFREQN